MNRIFMLCICLSMSVLSFAQGRTVKGKVLSAEDGNPIVGAFVQLMESKDVVTSTLPDGTFVLSNVPESSRTLSVSFIGMKTEEVKISNDLVIYLEADTELLDEVMVVAYGTVKKASYAGSAAQVQSKQLQDLPATSFESALIGKVSGVNITTSSGQAGSAPSIRIRGNGSMSASNEPLYVIDGIPVISGSVGQMGSYIAGTTNNVMSSLNMNDIESISVLKDAAASSLYGSRAANGVVVITTKQGKRGRPVVSLRTSIGFTPSWATANYEMADTQDQVNTLFSVFYDYANRPKTEGGQGKDPEAAVSAAISRLNGKFNKHGYEFEATDPSAKYQTINILEYDDSGRQGQYFDWDDVLFRTAVYQDYDLSVSGGNETSSYFSSIAYTRDQGRVSVNDFDRFSGRVNLNQKVGKMLEFATGVSLSRTSKSGFNDTVNTGSNYFYQSRNMFWGLYWPTDYKSGKDWTSRYGSYAYNPLYYNKEWENLSINTRISASETVTLHILPGLDAKTILSYDNTGVRDHVYYSPNHYLGSSANGKVNEMRTTYEKLVSSSTLNYNKSFAGKHSIGLLAGFEAEKNNTDFVRASGENMPSDQLHTVSTSGTTTSAGYNWGNSLVSIISKADYNYDEKYFLSASYRRDGSSRLSPKVRWGNFWSVSGAWRIISEPFMSGASSFLSDLKFRASYGVNGTLPTDNYGYINLMSYSNKYMGEPGSVLSTLANQNLSWETSYTANFGLDFGFFNQRLKGSVEYFNRDSRDLIQNVPVSTTTGFSKTLQNVGVINNHGVELSLSGDIIRRNGLVWSADFNTSFLKSTVSSLHNGEDIIWKDPTGSDGRAQFIYREGESTRAFWGYEYAGVETSTGKPVYYVNDSEDDQAGDFIYNGRGATYDFKKANYTIIGDAIPFMSGGFGTSLNWKNFDLNASFVYKIGGSLYDAVWQNSDDGYFWERTHTQYYIDNFWRSPEDSDAVYPEISGLDKTDAQQFSSRFINDASYLRLKSLTMGYTLPKSLIAKVGVSSLRVFFTGSNLWTLAAFKLADPEVNDYGTRGWETPLGKTFTFGVDIKF